RSRAAAARCSRRSDDAADGGSGLRPRAASCYARADVSTIAVYPGSFDPITNGHIDIVHRSLQVFDRVVVGVAFNPNKDSSWFSPEERVAMIRDAFRADGDRVVADAFSGLLVDYAVAKGASVIIRGLRAVADFE